MSSSPGAFWTRDIVDLSLGRLAGRFSAWYAAQFLDLFPSATRVWLLDRGVRRLTLSAVAGPPKFSFAQNERDGLRSPITPDELMASSLDEALVRRGLDRSTTRVILELPQQAFFVRRFDAPAAALSTLPRLLSAEIERKTPFHANDVVFGFLAKPLGETGDKIRVEQWILRRDLIERAIEGAGIGLSDIDLVQPTWTGGDGEPAPSIALGAQAAPSNWFRYTVVALLTLAALLLAGGAAMLVMRQDAVASQLDADIAQASARAARVRQIADRATAESQLLTTLREERRRYPSLADVWEEVSRLLPDGAYALEMRLSEGRGGERLVDLTGFAESAVGLPALLDRSPLFADAVLTAPITPDIREKRDAFSLQMKLRAATELKK